MRKKTYSQTLENDSDMIYAKAMDEAYQKEADIDALADKVIATGNPLYIYHFAAMIENAPIEKLTKAIVRTKNAKYIYYFAKTLENASAEELSYGIAFSNDFDYILYFAREIKGALIKLLSRAVIAMNDASYHYSNYITFAANVPNASVEDFASATIDTKDAIAIYLFAYLVPNAPIMKLAQAIIESNDAESIYQFAYDVKGAPIDLLMEALISIKSPNYICKAALEIPNVALTKLEEALITIGDIECYYQFIKGKKGANIKQFINVIFAFGCESEIIYYLTQCLFEPMIDLNQLLDIIFQSKNGTYIMTFQKVLRSFPIEKLLELLIQTKNPVYAGSIFEYIKSNQLMRIKEETTLCEKKELIKKLKNLKQIVITYLTDLDSEIDATLEEEGNASIAIDRTLLMSQILTELLNSLNQLQNSKEKTYLKKRENL